MKYLTCQVLRLEKEGLRSHEEFLPLEEEFRIFVNEDLFATVVVTPSQMKEFAVGHLYAQGAICHAGQIIDLSIQNRQIRAMMGQVSPSESGTDETNRTVGASSLLANMRSAIDSDLYSLTGGTHTSALCRGDDILIRAEDVGRLNTLDKILGWALLAGVDLKNCYVVTSGRITGTAVKKAVHAGVFLVASKGAVTSLAVELARERSVTLVGFVRDERMNLYSGTDRVSR